ncbi:MAG: branched-chain amino acid transaminase [Vicinamibacteria bacterium]
MNLDSKFVWMNGALVPQEKAVVPFLTPALHYGTAVFEGMRAYNTPQGPAIFRLRDHITRLFQSARIFGFTDLPWTEEQVIEGSKAVVRENGFTACYVRPLIFGASGHMGLSLLGVVPGLGIAAWEWKGFVSREAETKGLRANVSSFTRHHPNVMMTKSKLAGNYGNSVLARTESARLGFDEALMLDPTGLVAEGTGENLFAIRKGVIYTPHRTTVLEGLTRDSVIILARDLGYEVREEPLSRDQLYVADELFVCGTAAEVLGIRELDFRPIGAGVRGPITTKISETFRRVASGEDKKYADWIDLCR